MIDIDNNELINDLPAGFEMIYHTIANLKFEEEPPYDEIKVILKIYIF